MNILLVQPYNNKKNTIQKLLEQIHKILEKKSVDLVVFPEGFIMADSDEEAWNITEELACGLDTPVICGISFPDGTERALYVNIDPAEGETADSLFIKHSTANLLAFDLSNDELEYEQVYEPIKLKSQQIQVYICHDMFFPLITERLEREGLDILINLTGGNVKMSKWCNVLKGRSIELDTFVLCTMANRTDLKQPSDRIAYKSGKRLKANFQQGNGEKTHAFSLFSTEHPLEMLETEELFYSDKKYEQFTVALSEEADCIIDLDQFKVYSSKLLDLSRNETTMTLMKNDETVHVHLANHKDIFDRTYIYKQPVFEEGHHLVIYLSEQVLDEEEAIAMLKLRAIENRIGCIVASKNCLIGAKTNRYKDIQLFQPVEGKIGFDLQFMQGPTSIFQKSASNRQGIPIRFKEAYLRLMTTSENMK